MTVARKAAAALLASLSALLSTLPAVAMESVLVLLLALAFVAQKASAAPAVVHNAPVPKGMVTQKHQSVEVAAPTYKRGFVMPKLSGPVRLHASVQWLRGVVGHIRKDCRTATDVFLTTTLHPMRSKTQTVVSCLP